MTRARRILERISSVVFHGTHRDSLVSILSSNVFRLKRSVEDFSDKQIKGAAPKPYFLSVSRSVQNGYRAAFQLPVLLVLDGDKLNNHYSGHAVDYQNGGEGYDKSGVHNLQMVDFESEDRVWSREPEIPNACSYIKEIHILCSGTLVNLDDVAEAFKLAKNKGIPVFAYGDQSAFDSINKNRALKSTEFLWAERS